MECAQHFLEGRQHEGFLDYGSTVLAMQYYQAMSQYASWPYAPWPSPCLSFAPPQLSLDCHADGDEAFAADVEHSPSSPLSPPPGLEHIVPLAGAGLGCDAEGGSLTASARGSLCVPDVTLQSEDMGGAAVPLAGVSVDCLGNGLQRIRWVVHSKILKSSDKSAVSPAFHVELPSLGSRPFRMALYPLARGEGSGKGQGSFKKAKGRGRIELKCESHVPDPSLRLTATFSVGGQAPRAVSHYLAERSTCSLPKAEEEWDFSAAAETSRTFVVQVELGAECGARSPASASPAASDGASDSGREG